MKVILTAILFIILVAVLNIYMDKKIKKDRTDYLDSDYIKDDPMTDDRVPW